MSHLDDGLLTALLDNELDETEQRAAQAHLAACLECRRLLDEVKAMAAEADRLVASVEPPQAKAASRERVAAGGPAGRRRWQSFAWAASVVAAVGLGWVASDLRYREVATTPPTSGIPQDAAQPAARREISSTPAPPARVSAAVKQVTPAEIPESPPSPAPTVGNLEAAPPSAVAVGLARDRGALTLRGEAAGNKPAEVDSKSTALRAFRQGTMEEAVRTLGGSIRLVDGLEPERILLGSGSVVPDGGPPQDMVRVVYEDPPGRELWLEQQRYRNLDLASGATRSGKFLVGDTIQERSADGRERIVWMDQHGFLLGLTGFLTADSLHSMVPRVH